jgi:hypothetical protein
MELESYSPTSTYFTRHLETDANAISTEMFFHFESLLRLPTFNGKDVIVHIYCGGDLGSQLVHLNHAISRVQNETKFKFQCSILNNIDLSKLIKSDGWGCKDLVDWLLTSHIHFVICHPHQGLFSKGVDITPIQMYKEMQRLRYHLGLPNEDNLNCPIFQQDKAVYLNLLNDQGFCNPTLVIHTYCNLSSYESKILS